VRSKVRPSGPFVSLAKHISDPFANASSQLLTLTALSPTLLKFKNLLCFPSLINPSHSLVNNMAENGRPTLDWAKHEGEIRDLFVSQGKTLKEVMAHMRKQHNFEARYIDTHPILSYWIIELTKQKSSERGYKSRFSKLKNVKADEWIWIGQEMQHRAALGKESEPRLHDKPLPLDRVVREIARHKNKAPAATLSNREYTNTEFLVSLLI